MTYIDNILNNNKCPNSIFSKDSKGCNEKIFNSIFLAQNPLTRLETPCITLGY